MPVSTVLIDNIRLSLNPSRPRAKIFYFLRLLSKERCTSREVRYAALSKFAIQRCEFSSWSLRNLKFKSLKVLFEILNCIFKSSQVIKLPILDSTQFFDLLDSKIWVLILSIHSW
jgi:hypothetical protein